MRILIFFRNKLKTIFINYYLQSLELPSANGIPAGARRETLYIDGPPLVAVHCSAKYILMTVERCTRSAMYIPMADERCTRTAKYIPMTAEKPVQRCTSRAFCDHMNVLRCTYTSTSGVPSMYKVTHRALA